MFTLNLTMVDLVIYRPIKSFMVYLIIFFIIAYIGNLDAGLRDILVYI